MLRIYEPSLAEEKYFELKKILEKKYDQNDYVVIYPKTGEYYVSSTSVGAIRKARVKHPSGKLFLAQVGRMSGLLKCLIF